MRISILGAGVGGLSTAIALKQKGFDVEIFERDSTTTEIGAGIVCWPNASFVLEELGLLEEIEKVSGRPARMRRLSSQGEELGSLDILQLNEKMGFPSLSILRKDLMKILVSKASELGISINYSHLLTQLESKPDGKAIAHFENGKSNQSDILIGADGRMNSVTRQFINDDNRPVYQKFINWIGVFETDKPVFQNIEVTDFWGVGERFGIVPITEKVAYWAGGVAAENVGARESIDYKNELTALFGEWPDPISQIIKDTPVNRINKIYVHDHNPIETWHRDNVLMIGDAAHAPLPTSGQGACQALEDAWHLSNLLQENSSDLEETFTTFTKQRQAKTTGITMGARQFASSLFNTDPDYCQQRNQNSKNTDYLAAVQGMAKGWASGLPLG